MMKNLLFLIIVLIILLTGCTVLKRDIKKEWLIEQYTIYYNKKGYTNVVVTPLY